MYSCTAFINEKNNRTVYSPVDHVSSSRLFCSREVMT